MDPRSEHVHTPATAVHLRPFFAPVAPDARDLNPAAHGGRTWTEICLCGARREVNGRTDAREFGSWGAAAPAVRVAHDPRLAAA